MDKYELKVTISEIDSLISKRRFREAAEVADSVDWRRVKNVRTLCRISDVYKLNRRYHDSKRVLELAYAKSPYGRQIIFSLCELELKLGNYVRALQLYNEYINVAPRDADRYVLQYKLYKAQNVSVNERIAVLEDLAKHDFRDKWAYELAKLYLEAGERTLCASECDEIIAFFGYGRYVYKALELKASFTELTVKQKALFRKMNGEEEEEEESGAESGSTPDAETIRIPARSDSPEADAEKEAARGEDSNDTGEEPDLDTGKEQVRAPEEGTDLSETEQDKEDGQAQGGSAAAADESGDSVSGQTPEPAQKEEMIPALNREPAAEIPWEYEDYRISPGELKKKPAKKSRDSERGQEDSSAGRPDIQKKPARSGTTAPAPAADHTVFEDRSFEVSSVEESIFSQERMQETIAKGLRNLENYDPYLRQETDGQYAMVIQEDPKPEKQITGQLNLEEIMNEWEKVKRDFYEYNGLEDDAPPQKAPSGMKKAPLTDAKRENAGSTKSWDPGEVHKALEIRDNDEESAGYDTSLFVTEGGGAFPKEFAVEQMTLTRTDGKGSKGQMYLHSEDSIRQLTDAVNRLRVIAMSRNEKDTVAYNFMKSKWRLFLMRRRDVPDRVYTRKSDGETWHYDELIRHCLSLDADLRNAYDCLQDLYRYMRVEDTFARCLENVGFVATRLENCRNEILAKVAATYRKWAVPIAMGLAKNQFGMVFTNAKMEAGNDVAQTMIDAAYGYRNFERFRKRFLLMRRARKG